MAYKRELVKAVLDRDVLKAGLVISKMRNVDVTCDTKGNTVLSLACDVSLISIVEHMLERGADPNKGNSSGFTPLHLAALQNAELVELLLNWGANPNCLDHIWGQTPLNLAAGHVGDIDVVKLLVDAGTDINVADKRGHSALSKACNHDFEEVAQFLIEHGADVNLKLIGGHTPLHLLVPSGRPEIVQLLLRNGANCNAVNGDGNTPLQEAILSFFGKLDVINMLLKGTDIDNQNEKGETALHQSIRTTNVVRREITKMLIDYKANLKLKTKDNESVFDLCDEIFDPGIGEMLDQATKAASQ